VNKSMAAINNRTLVGLPIGRLEQLVSDNVRPGRRSVALGKSKVLYLIIALRGNW
jgi:hypothetical protein